jgi:DNA invertase Pin-like site-specific DNA recombinase
MTAKNSFIEWVTPEITRYGIIGYGTGDTDPDISDQLKMIALYAYDCKAKLRGLFADRSASIRIYQTQLDKALKWSIALKVPFVVMRLSNLSRSFEAVLQVICKLLDTKTPFISIEDFVNTAQQHNENLERMIHALSDMKSSVINDVINSLEEDGKPDHKHGRMPYGMRCMKKRSVIYLDENEIEVISRILNYRREGFSYWKIAKELNQQHIRSRKDRSWHPKVVMSIVKRYKGNKSLIRLGFGETIRQQPEFLQEELQAWRKTIFDRVQGEISEVIKRKNELDHFLTDAEVTMTK